MIKLIIFTILVVSVSCQLGLPGGRRDVNLTDISKEELANLNRLANFGINKIAEKRVKESNGKSVKLSLVRLSKAQKQVVAGVNYFLTVKIKPENCQNECDVETCEMTIWEKPWENFTEMTEFNCKKEHSLFGSNIRIDNNDKYALKALEYAVNQLNNESNDLYKYKIESVDKIYRQVVNGMKYTFVFKMVKTDCAKNAKDAKLLSDCAVGQNAQTKNVKVSVLDKPWVQGNRYELKSSVYF